MIQLNKYMIVTKCDVFTLCSAFKSARYRPAQSGDVLPQSVSAVPRNVSVPAGVVSASYVVSI